MLLTIDCSDYTGATSKLPKILINGNNICMVIEYYPWWSYFTY